MVGLMDIMQAPQVYVVSLHQQNIRPAHTPVGLLAIVGAGLLQPGCILMVVGPVAPPQQGSVNLHYDG